MEESFLDLRFINLFLRVSYFLRVPVVIVF
jgi:hypothetical protein